MSVQIDIDAEALAGFCRRNRNRRLSFFGSVLREDFRPDSDIDILRRVHPRCGGWASSSSSVCSASWANCWGATSTSTRRRASVTSSGGVGYRFRRGRLCRIGATTSSSPQMIEAAEAALEFTDGQTVESVAADRLVFSAVVRAVQLVGQAARGVSQELQTAHPEIPRREMVGMRNVVVHDYADVDMALVGKTVRDDLPGLVERLRAILDEDGGA